MTTEISIKSNPVLDACARAGIPAIVRPWWGSARHESVLIHTLCGKMVSLTNLKSLWCYHCSRKVPVSEIKRVRKGFYLCPAGYSYNRITRPEVQGGRVVLWEGPCHLNKHTHQQSLTVIDESDSALLIEVKVCNSGTRFLVGLDDNHPFVTSVNRKPETVQDAFDWLVPNKVREAFILGKDVVRQGDWYFIPFEKKLWTYKGQPGEEDVLYRRPILRMRIHVNFLNHDVPLVYGWGGVTRHRAELAVYKHILGLPYPVPVVKGRVTAPDHPDKIFDDWHIAIRHRRTSGSNLVNRNDD